MKKPLLALLLLASPAAHAQSAADLVTAWLVANGKPTASANWSTCDPSPAAIVGTDGLCIWNTGVLGAQPSVATLQAMASAVVNMKQAAQYQTIIAAGIAITSTGNPAGLNGTYAVDQGAQLNIDSQIASILKNGTFTNGQATRVWHDLAGAPHTFTVAQFSDLATKIGSYVDSVLTTMDTLRSGSSASWPTAAATIQ